MNPARFLVALCLALSFFDGNTLAAPYGLSGRAAVGPFLNGAMPSTRPGNSIGEYYTEDAFPNLTFNDPTLLIAEPGTNRLYVLGRQGTIHFFINDPNTTTKTLF